MIMIKGLLLFGFLALMSGCATSTCPPPSYPTANGDNCWYKLTVKEINKTGGWVKGKYPQDLIGEDKADPATVYTFQVRDLDWLIEKNRLVEGSTYYFNNDHGSPFLVPFPAGWGPEGYANDRK
jgi:hypothetical protein